MYDSKDWQFVDALARGLNLPRGFGPGDTHPSKRELARPSARSKPTTSPKSAAAAPT